MALLETAREFLKRIGANRHMIEFRPLIIATSVMMIAMPHVFGQSSLTLVGSVPGFSDRKSTRLNSSHRCISYAVFCLKKIKNNTKLHPHPSGLGLLGPDCPS